jgi:DNA polymerase-3 subunit delta'
MTIEILRWHIAPLHEILKRRGKLSHAYLIHGREGIGKVEFARVLAQSLLCEDADQGGIACGTCPACHWFTQGNHPDFREIIPAVLQADAAGDEGETVAENARPEKKSTQITIDQVRDIGQFVALSTHRDGYRVILIHPAETMNQAAANALLKTLEEPTPRTLILLVTNRLGRLMATVRSRCQKLLVTFPAQADALAWLKTEGVDEPATLLAQAGGAPLLARDWADADYQAQRRIFLNALGDPAHGDWVALAASYEKSNLQDVVRWLQTWCCDLIYQKSAVQIRHHPDFTPAIERVAQSAPLVALFRYESSLRSTRRTIAHPLNARLVLEQLLISYADTVTFPSR